MQAKTREWASKARKKSNENQWVESKSGGSEPVQFKDHPIAPDYLLNTHLYIVLAVTLRKRWKYTKCSSPPLFPRAVACHRHTTKVQDLISSQQSTQPLLESWVKSKVQKYAEWTHPLSRQLMACFCSTTLTLHDSQPNDWTSETMTISSNSIKPL